MTATGKAEPGEPLYLRLVRHGWTHLVLAAFLLAFDYASGSAIQFPITFVIPVALAAWFCRSRLGYLLALLMPLLRAGFVFLWENPVAPLILLANAVIRIGVLLLIAFLARRAARLAREVKVLQGILPICSFCKKIRDSQDRWQHIETYIRQRTDADFSHGICPECMQIHYGDIRYRPRTP